MENNKGKIRITFETGWVCASRDLLEDVKESPSLHTGICCAFGRLYRWARTLQTSSIADFSASNTSHHGSFSGRGTWNLRAAAYTTPQATTSLLNWTHKVVRKLFKGEQTHNSRNSILNQTTTSSERQDTNEDKYH